MSTPSIKTNLELGGEKEYRQAISEINSGLRVLKSEMDLTRVQFEENADSVEGLTKKNDVLDRQILSQKDKIETLKAALQHSAQTYGEADKKTQDWQISLNKAESELVKMERESGKTTKAIENLGKGQQESTKATKGLGDAIGDVSQKFGINIPSDVTKGLNSFAELDLKTVALVGSFAALAAAIIAVTTKLSKLTIEQAKVADDILTTSTITGIGTEKLQEYAYAAELVDVSVDTITDSQSKLIRSMSSAQKGTAETAEAFEKLGVSYMNADGSLRDHQDVFWDAIDAMGRMANETERDAVAMQLMGRSAQELNPLINAGSETMKDLAKEAQDMGYILDDKALASLGRVDDAMQRYNNTIDATKKQLATEFSPYLEQATKNLTSFVSNLGGALRDSGIVDAFGMLLETLSDILAPADTFAEDTVPKMTQAIRPLAMLIAGIADTLDFFTGLFTLDFAKVKKAFGAGYTYGNGNHMQTIREQWEQTDINSATRANGYGQYYANGKWYSNYDEYLRTVFKESGYSGTFEAWKNANGYNAAGDDNWIGGTTWVGENGPEKVYLPQGTKIQNAQESKLSEGGDVFYITIDAASIKEFNDIVRIAKNKRRVTRMGHSE